MKPIDALVKILREKWRKKGDGRTPTADEVLAAVYDPDTNSIKGKSV